MPSNEQRRAAAKRKLERQVASRAQRARKRKQMTILASAVGVVVAVAAGVGIYYWTKGDDADTTASACDFRAAQSPAARPVDKPGKVGKLSDVKNAKATLDTTEGPIPVQLNAEQSPCTVKSFENLANQKFFDDTKCHRMTTTEGLKVLQCGDPSASGSGGPGYEFDNEYPTAGISPMDPAADTPIDYKRGTLAMANSGPGTNGSQFFLVYGDSKLPPQYTIFGTVDEAGLATLDKIAAAGVQGGGQDGPPVDNVAIKSVKID
ncbi:peptidylprolyl isomerase [Nocardia sp. NPDC052001]|uniref:peptidylprolyl isomerase n=1 Tax=Nocardia sp. NPDC052001 TaxID=3154853 RepID=UPI0034390130